MIEWKCKNCGSCDLEFDSKKLLVCKQCGSVFLLSKEEADAYLALNKQSGAHNYRVNFMPDMATVSTSYGPVPYADYRMLYPE